MNENVGIKTEHGKDKTESFLYNEPIVVNCISNERYESVIKKGRYIAVGECRDHYIVNSDIRVVVIPKCRFEIN